MLHTVEITQAALSRYSSRLIHSSIVHGSFGPAPKVTVGNTVTVHPIRVEPAIGGADGRRSADAGYRRARDHGQVILDAERIVVGLGLELDAARLAIAVLHARGGLLERRLVGLGDLLEEIAVAAAACPEAWSPRPD